MGLPGCSSSEHPCPLCTLPTASLPGIRHFSALGNDVAKTWQQYSDACSRCEITVGVTDETFPLLRAALRPDRRKDKSRGWALVADVAVGGVNLQIGDRLEPTPSMMFVSSFFSRPRPFVATFWRRSQETAARHRNPLFSVCLGVVPAHVLGVDTLHTVALGVCKYFCSRAAHALISANAFQVSNAPESVMLDASVKSLRAELF
eukprot:1629746-Pyramimonas_sp.AAC.1